MTVWHEQQHEPITWEMFLDERYALVGGSGKYVHIGTAHRDMGAVQVTDPFAVEIRWERLEVAPRV